MLRFRRVSACVLAATVLLSTSAAAQAYDFPGKGDRQAWLQACDLANQSAAMIQSGQFDAAFKGFHRAVELYSFDPVLTYNVGLAHQQYAYMVGAESDKLAQLNQAQEYFKKAGELKPDTPEIWIHLANVQCELGKYQDSLSSLERTLKIATLSESDRASTLQAMEVVKGKMSVATGSASPQNSAKQETATNISWKSFKNDSIALKHPEGWKVTADSKTGQIDLDSADGARLTLLPFSTDKTISPSAAPLIFKTFIKLIAPQEQWSEPQRIGEGSFQSTYSNSTDDGVAAISFRSYTNSTAGRVAVAKHPKSAGPFPVQVFAEIIASLSPLKPAQIASAQTQGDTRPDSSAGSSEDDGDDDSGSDSNSSSGSDSDSVSDSGSGSGSDSGSDPDSDSESDSDEGSDSDSDAGSDSGTGSNYDSNGSGADTGSESQTANGAPGQSPVPFSGWTTFRDPDQGSFTVEVPAGWKVEGGMVRPRPIDARPWMRAISPDGLVAAFIGDGKIPGYTMPNGQLTTLGFGPGRWYNGSLVAQYIPARTFAEKYAVKYLKPYATDIRVVEAYNHPDVARAVNGTVGASKSEAVSIKITANKGAMPLVGYYLCCTKATVGYGTGMWWVTKIAGVVCPAQMDRAGLGLILHMLQTFQIDPQWGNESIKTAGQVSRNYRAASQQVSNSIMNRYWSQQAANESIHNAYWNRQASQDRAANRYSDAFRGVENVRDPNTGTNYQVQYGPDKHWMDNLGNYQATDANTDLGHQWHQLMTIPD
ncbi:MAG: tetratricopeptide repeat protein [Cyanobacteria bacterium HKST-UBA02]|nr:tetratricopeptide repeat protein [Cyanobacteria bacterium HKST-UBA02]